MVSAFYEQNRLRARVADALAPWLKAPCWHVAFSGGLDSTVLLHIVAYLARQGASPALQAIHVHHGLLGVADTWVVACQRTCEQFQVPLVVEHVRVDQKASLERAARDARYAALSAYVEAGDIVLTAQHRDDQAETLLLRLLRGAGVKGLASMATSRRLGSGFLVRPLLNVPRAELLAYAQAEGLNWVEDPSNAQTVQDRNYLRHEIIPRLQVRWPGVTTNLARSAEHMAEALEILDERAYDDVAQAQRSNVWPWLDLPSLDLETLKTLSEARQRNAIRYWLQAYTRMPDTNHWAGWHALRDASASATPAWRLEQGEVQRGAGRIWWLPAAWLKVQPSGTLSFDQQNRLSLGANGWVELQGKKPAGHLQVRYRQGGEIMYAPRRGHRDLKRLLNERQVPAFLRARLPLLFCDDNLVAVANLEGLDSAPDKSWRLVWYPSTNGLCLS
ncbi:tRNA(Ile)-lysidine synthase [Pseudomonas duriflava]|uniref:tRNA(Ile)-lysidine synthase n=1 Tax=Pseudomonas duriflava TaxID=459528 RepID=A0A562QFI9_9PSED|nr:tRNA lysidine(34) synthetase TilS [Pseudomonas duriflava]TWI55501.1 tRNA(Ile)-lysidine synthase [Pseudomonas duriflava]